MPWYYRKRKGNLNLSFSRRGPRISFGVGGGKSGCLLPVLVVVLGSLGIARALVP